MSSIIMQQEIAEVLLIKPQVHGDVRGFFMESFNANEMKKYGVNEIFFQDNIWKNGNWR